MCGITGFIDNSINYDIDVISNQMGNALQLRGPDGFGCWQDRNLGISLIHRRLAILDLSASGHQPMISSGSRYVITFNGEIYNWQSIKNELETKCGPISWRGSSDTEVILMAVEIFGFNIALEKIEGAFAIALWDRQEHELYLIRDRMGEKPLYYGYFNGVFGFASELKALKPHPKFNPEVDPNAIGQLVMHSCIPAPLSIFSEIKKLLPGHYLKISYNHFLKRIIPNSIKYWSLTNCANPTYNGNEDLAVDDLEKLLSKVISEQVVADVPLGCFLSGGVDSSTVAALMQNLSSTPINTFCIGFDNKIYNEAEFAKAVANHIGSNHNEIYVNEKDALQVIPNLAMMYDEPFSDSSQIPTYLVLISHCLNNNLVNGLTHNESLWRAADKFTTSDHLRFMQYFDSIGYLPDDILTKVDRASMANSLEVRVPLLNHRVVEFAYSLPTTYKIKDNVSKWPLRQVLYKYVPKQLIERPKCGFEVPLKEWLRGDLKNWAYDLLDDSKLNQQGYFNSKVVQQKLHEHISGKADNSHFLWDILIFQQWYENWKRS